jgi:hypothetical protein
MSAHWYAEPDPEPRRNGSVARFAKIAAAVVSVGVLAMGAKAIADGGSSSSAGASGVQGGASSPPGHRAGTPGGAPPGFGSDVTGATLDKLESAVAGRYPGSVERASKLPDGSYVVHVIRSNGQEVHVLVSKDFKVTGAQQGGPGRSGGRPPSAGQAAPGGSTPS